MKAIKWLDEHFEEALLVVLLVTIAVVELLQVVVRNIPAVPSLTWAEELCRFCWIASVFISLPYTIRKGTMLRVSVLADMLPDKLNKALNIFVDIVNTAAMALLAYASVGVLQGVIASGETSPAMLLPMWIMYVIVLAGFGLGAVRGIQQAILHVIHFGDKALSAEEKIAAEAAEELSAVAMEGGDR